MIRIRDAFLLARTKLRLRIMRLAFTIFASSLVFALLFFVVFVFAGASKSLQEFGKEGLGGRYIVSGAPFVYSLTSPDSKEVVKIFKPQYDAMIIAKKAAAKRLNITYDPMQDQSMPLVEVKLPNGEKQAFVQIESPIVKAYIAQKNKENTSIQFNNFKKLGMQQGAVAFYQSSTISYFGQASDSVEVLRNGKEQPPSTGFGSAYNSDPKGISTLVTLGWNQFDKELLLPFVLPGQSLAVGKDGSVPVIAPYSAAEEILNLTELPKSASNSEKITRLEYVRKNLPKTKATICYRNAASKTLLTQAYDQVQQAEQNKNNKDYIAPSLQYNVPSQACGAVTIKKDTRTAEEKKEAQNTEAFKSQFGETTTPEQFVISVRIVGMVSDLPTSTGSFTASDLMSSILKSSVGSSWYSPSELVSGNTNLAKAMRTAPLEGLDISQKVFYAEFPTYQSAKTFIEKNSTCNSSQAVVAGIPQSVMSEPYNGFPPCVKKGQYFGLSPFGNNAGAVKELQDGFWIFAKYAGLVATLIAGLIMMANLGKIITDSRRETAVFRALGARRGDIALVYILYTSLIAAFVAILSVVIGFAAALYLHSQLSPSLSLQAVIAYNSNDITKQFYLFGYNFKYVWLIVALIFIAALVSAIGPLLSNIRRNPIKDMRDEG